MEQQRLINATPLENQLLFEASAQAGTDAGPGYGKALRLVKDAPTVQGAVIVKCNLMLHQEGYAALAKKLAKQVAAGAMALPEYCELLAEVPQDSTVLIVAEANGAGKKMSTKELTDLVKRLPGLTPDQEQVFVETILYAYNKGGADRVAAVEDELRAAMDYIEETKSCETCAHCRDINDCSPADFDCRECTRDCICKGCMNGSKWEWRHKHGG